MAAWETRHEAAIWYNRANKLEDLANERLSDAILAMTDTPATTIEGLRCKARASAKAERANAEPDLAWSMVDDLAEPADYS